MNNIASKTLATVSLCSAGLGVALLTNANVAHADEVTTVNAKNSINKSNSNSAVTTVKPDENSWTKIKNTHVADNTSKVAINNTTSQNTALQSADINSVKANKTIVQNSNNLADGTLAKTSDSMRVTTSNNSTVKSTAPVKTEVETQSREYTVVLQSPNKDWGPDIKLTTWKPTFKRTITTDSNGYVTYSSWEYPNNDEVGADIALDKTNDAAAYTSYRYMVDRIHNLGYGFDWEVNDRNYDGYDNGLVIDNGRLLRVKNLSAIDTLPNNQTLTLKLHPLTYDEIRKLSLGYLAYNDAMTIYDDDTHKVITTFQIDPVSYLNDHKIEFNSNIDKSTFRNIIQSQTDFDLSNYDLKNNIFDMYTKPFKLNNVPDSAMFYEKYGTLGLSGLFGKDGNVDMSHVPTDPDLPDQLVGFVIHVSSKKTDKITDTGEPLVVNKPEYIKINHDNLQLETLHIPNEPIHENTHKVKDAELINSETLPEKDRVANVIDTVDNSVDKIADNIQPKPSENISEKPAVSANLKSNAIVKTISVAKRVNNSETKLSANTEIRKSMRKAELPKAGSNNNIISVVIGGLLTSISLFGFGFHKKRA